MSRPSREAGRGASSALPRILTFCVVAVAVVALDQLSKAAVRATAPQVGRFGTLVPGLLDLVHVENTGAAFSMGEGAGPLFVAAALAVALGAFVLVVRERLPLPLVATIACVAGGGIGNLVDRVTQGSVTDFIATTFIDFPVFNVADIFVTCGVIASFIGYVAWERRISNTENSEM